MVPAKPKQNERLPKMTALRKPMQLAALLSLWTLTACQTTQIAVGTDASCRAFKVITYAGTDHVETRRQVRGHNAAWRSLCE